MTIAGPITCRKCGHHFDGIKPDFVCPVDDPKCVWLPAAERQTRAPETDRAKICAALDIAAQYGGIDGDHHKAWVIDQMVRALTGDAYAAFIADARSGEDGPETYFWNEGIAP